MKIEKSTHPNILYNEIGSPINFSLKNFHSVGTSHFYSKGNEEVGILENSRCNLQAYTNGLVLHANISNRITRIAIKKEKIDKIILTSGNEEVNPTFPSPFYFALKYGVPLKKAKYFPMISKYEYINFGKTKLCISFNKIDYNFEANFSTFYALKAFFQRYILKKKIELKHNLIIKNFNHKIKI